MFSRMIDVTMRETDDGGMIFEPNSLEISEAETIRFNVMNKGELEYEFVIDAMEGKARNQYLLLYDWRCLVRVGPARVPDSRKNPPK